MNKYIKHSEHYTNEQLTSQIKQVTSMRQLINALELKQSGTSHKNLKSKIEELNIDISHWAGQSWRKNKQLKEWFNYKRGSNCKKHLINLRGHQCEICKLTHWLNELINLEIHHIDGNKDNNNLNNIQLLCLNCHSFTDNFRNRGRLNPKEKIIHKCMECNLNTVSRKYNSCRLCSQKNRDWSSVRKAERPSLEQLIEDLKEMSMVKVGKKYGVSDNAIRKWLKAYNYDYR